MILYITEAGTYLKKNYNSIEIVRENTVQRKIPMEQVESIVLIDSVIVSGKLIETFLQKNISLLWIGKNGNFFGKLYNTKNTSILDEYKQFRFYENDKEKLKMARAIIKGKSRNQYEILYRYSKNTENEKLDKVINDIKIYSKSIDTSKSIESLLGIEGNIARSYFKGIGELMPDNFKFEKRSKQPPLDPVNSVLSFGYTLLMYEVYNAIVSKKLNPNISVLHKLSNGHPALCSDIMEEFRPCIIDTIVINMFKNSEFKTEDFDIQENRVYISNEGIKKFLNKYNKKILSSHKFLGSTMTYRESILHQVGIYKKIINGEELEYRSMIIH